ncbi:Rieske 2Fe-2S domain-containing protein [Marinicellulosiphila megalodicopiae]|uniref:Rieske 2Fe-2S domain-containing protein n=1 Tax=Marinicellulosiphila megalodicopiae TaxID=2724896 RepID=UPI003BB2237B
MPNIKTKAMRQAYDKKMFDRWGHLPDYWYPLIELKSLRKNSMKKVRVFGLDYVVWKNKQGGVSVFLDSCIHKQAPLSAGHLQNNNMQCPYHGWQFDMDGHCVDIPYSNDKQGCEKKSLLVLPAKIKGKVIWFFPGNQNEFKKTDINWQYLSNDMINTQIFECDEQALIENFMDSPHTNFVHTGIIRKDQKFENRDIEIKLDDKHKLSVDHLPNNESLGPFNWFINPNKDPITHQDGFVAPAEIDIQYQFEKDKTNFRTHVFLAPIDECNTRAFIKISCQFKRFNPLIRLGLRLFSPIVLKQDQKMVSLQAKNPSKLNGFNGEFINYDMYSYQVKLLRQQAKTKQTPVGLLTSTFHTSLKL